VQDKGSAPISSRPAPTGAARKSSASAGSHFRAARRSFLHVQGDACGLSRNGSNALDNSRSPVQGKQGKTVGNTCFPNGALEVMDHFPTGSAPALVYVVDNAKPTRGGYRSVPPLTATKWRNLQAFPRSSQSRLSLDLRFPHSRPRRCGEGLLSHLRLARSQTMVTGIR